MATPKTSGLCRASLAAWAGSLRFRLTAVVVTAVLAVVGVAMLVDYRRAYHERLEAVLAALTEQAQALKVARKRISQPAAFARHVDEFCAQMNAYISPGHHILVLDGQGNVLAASRRHSGAEVEQALLSAGAEQQILSLPGHRLAQTRVRDGSETIIVAQYLEHVEAQLRAQLLSRGITAATTAGVLIVLLVLTLRFWVLGPFSRLKVAARAWARRDFSARAEPAGPTDLRALAGDFNAMAGQLLAHQQQQLAELAVARQIQTRLLPSALPKVANLAFATAYQPAEHVAGDLYDIFPLSNGRAAVAILDVAGHGISAALLTGVVKMTLHRRLAECDDPSQALAKVHEDLTACLLEGRFVTACVGIWEGQDRSWTYTAAGHPGGLVLSEGQVRSLETSGPALGLPARAAWARGLVRLRPGDRLFLYTDGAADAGAPHNRLGELGLGEILRATQDVAMNEQVRRLMAEIAHRGEGAPTDDVTILAMEVS